MYCPVQSMVKRRVATPPCAARHFHPNLHSVAPMAAVEVSTLTELRTLPGNTLRIRLRDSSLAGHGATEWLSALCIFKGLACLHLKWPSLASLPESLGQMRSLQTLDLTGCSSLASLPDSLGQLSSLEVLDLGGCGSLTSLPESLRRLSSLIELNLLGCRSLASLTESLGQLGRLERLVMRDCSSLTSLPDSLGQLSNLQVLDLSGCYTLASLPNTLGQLSSLLVLDMSDCSKLPSFPEPLCQLSRLRVLVLQGWLNLTSLPESLGQLSRLNMLGLWRCSSLTSLPKSLGQLSRMQCLNLVGCTSLTSLPDSFGQLSGLHVLDMQWCSSLAILPESLGRLSSLQVIKVVGCVNLAAQPPDSWSAARKLSYILRAQTQRQAVLKLAMQQEPMLTTLERMSWLVVLLATATFIAFLQPPGGYADDSNGQVWVSNFTSCGGAASGVSETRSCAMFVFFVLDSLSFGFSMGCVILIVVLSMPRIPYKDDEVEAGRFWLLLFTTWLLLYLAVVTGVGAFAASGVAVYNELQVVLAPLGPGVLLIFLGLLSFYRRFYGIFPGRKAVSRGVATLFSLRDGALRPAVEEEPVGQQFLMSSEFWERAGSAMRDANRELVLELGLRLVGNEQDRHKNA